MCQNSLLVQSAAGYFQAFLLIYYIIIHILFIYANVCSITQRG